MAELTEKGASEKAPKTVQSIADFSAEELIEKYKKPVLAGLGVVAVLVAAFVFYRYNQTQNNDLAKEEMTQAVFYFEQDSFNLALNGIEAKEIKGLKEVADEYSSTPSGKLASLYAGIIYLKQGKFEDAINYLGQYDSNDGIMQARSYAATGDAYSELNDLENATKFYKKAAEHVPNEQLTPAYLMKLGLAYELSNNWKDAAETYGKIVTEYPKSQDVSDAKKYKAKALALSASE